MSSTTLTVGGDGTGDTSDIVSTTTDSSPESIRKTLVETLWVLAEKTVIIRRSTNEVSRIQSVKGFDGRSSGGQELVVTTEYGHFEVVTEGYPLSRLFGPESFGSHTGTTQNLRSRFVQDRVMIEYVQACSVAYIAMKTSRTIDSIPCAEYNIASDSAYKVAVIAYLEQRVSELTDADASEILNLLTLKSIKLGSKRLEKIIDEIVPKFVAARLVAKPTSSGYTRSWKKKP